MTSQSRALVVGFGSIGERHAQVLSGMGLDVGVVSRRQVSGYQGFSGLEAALESLSPAYVVVADETARHGETVRRIGQSGYAGTVLVEKPLLSSPAPLPKSDFAAMAVGYQLRFHPAVRALRARLAGEASVVAMLEVGQNLSQWRPGRDWRQGYSASRKAGGGVLRDLSHELDLMLWLFGPWRRLAALGGRGEALGVAADDTATVLVETARCPSVTLALDYLARPLRRRIVVETVRHSFVLDLASGRLAVDGAVEVFAADTDGMLAEMHRAVINNAGGYCTAEEGIAVVEMIAAIEAARDCGTWVEEGFAA